jgi:hypothetical protein
MAGERTPPSLLKSNLFHATLAYADLHMTENQNKARILMPKTLIRSYADAH